MSIPKGKFLKISHDYQIHYHDEGQGEPVVFLHGSGQGASGYSNFKKNSAYFKDHNYRALMPDLLGFGLSSKPDDIQYSMELHLDTLKDFIDGLELKKISLVGNSLGGAVALHFALRFPECVEKLILLAPGGIEHKEAYMKMPGIRQVYKIVQGTESITKDDLREMLELQLYDRRISKASSFSNPPKA